LKGKWSIRQRHRFHSTPSVLSFLAGIPPALQYCLPKGERKYKGLISHSQVSVLAIHAKGGESISPKQKDRTITNFKNVVLREDFSIDILFLIKFSNWYNLFQN
jgi:hypothetical protein